MSHASSDSEMDSYDRAMDDAMGIDSDVFRSCYSFSDVEDPLFEYDSCVESSSEDESVVDSDGEEALSEESILGDIEDNAADFEVEDFVEENLIEVPVDESKEGDFEATEKENTNLQIPVEPINFLEWLPKRRDIPPENNSLSWDTPPVENDGIDGECSVNIGIEEEYNGEADGASRTDGEKDDYGVDSDGENPVERNEFEISMAVVDVNEEPVRHDVYYESEDDSKEERAARQERSRNFTPRFDGLLFKGQTFFNGLAFKEAFLHHALKNQKEIRQIRYDKKKLIFKCLGKGKKGISCRWRVYCSIRRGASGWRIRKITPDHNCVKSGDCAMLKVTSIARLFVDKIRDEPAYFMPMKIEDVISERWGVSVTRNQTQAARGMALKWIEAEYDDQFRRLRDYAAEIIRSNPGSSVAVQSYKNSAGEDVFLRFYVCFVVLRRSWKETCRPLLGIDGSFLKSKVRGQLLVAMGRDANNQIYPVAWGVVEKENTDNWEWFVEKLQKDLSLGDGGGFVMVSDRQKGLISAVKKRLPGIEHMHCVRHIYANMKGRFGTRDPMKKFVWDLAWSYNEAEYRERLEDIRRFDREVFNYVVNSDPTSWCRAFYRLGPCCEDVENNSTESFNRTVAKARERPFVPMLEMIRSQAMHRISKRNEETERYESVLTPYALEQVELEEDDAKDCKIKASTSGMYQSSLRGCSHCVNLLQKTCTCRKWQIKGIPCEHAYGVILKRKLNVADYVSTWFHAETWRRTYEEGITVPTGARFWPRGSHPAINYPPNAKEMG